MKKEKEPICQDFYFYPNGEYTTKSVWKSKDFIYDNDVEQIQRKIRIYGTEEQVEAALESYAGTSKLNLDEVYDFKIEPKGSYWYNIYKNPDKINSEVKLKLEYYAEKYSENKNKALIINI